MGGAAIPEAAVAGAAGAAATYLRMTDASDPVLMRAGGTALALAEAFCGQLLVARACEDSVATMPGWQRLAAVPVRQIEAANGLAVDIDVGGIGWVRVTEPGAASVRYVAGLAGEWAALPEPLAQGVVLLTVHLFEHRADGAAPPAAVAALWRPYRRMRLQAEVRA